MGLLLLFTHALPEGAVRARQTDLDRHLLPSSSCSLVCLCFFFFFFLRESLRPFAVGARQGRCCCGALLTLQRPVRQQQQEARSKKQEATSKRQTEMDARDKEIQMLKNQNIELQKEIVRLMKRCHNAYQRQDEGIQSTVEKSRTKEKRIKALNHRIEELNALLTRSEETINTLTTHLTDLRQEKEGLERQLVAAREAQTNSQTTIVTLYSNVRDLTQQLETLRTQCSTLPTLSQEMGRACSRAVESVESSGRLQATLVRLYEAEAKKRKTLFDEVQTLRGNFRVFCRVRPLISREASNAESTVVSVSSVVSGLESDLPLGFKINETLVAVEGMRESSNPNKTSNRMVKGCFEFERAFGPSSSQATVFEELCPLITSVVDGQNCCILAYGQTGSGKTHTMVYLPSFLPFSFGLSLTLFSHDRVSLFALYGCLAARNGGRSRNQSTRPE